LIPTRIDGKRFKGQANDAALHGFPFSLIVLKEDAT
jgi:hypothetical protein